MKSLAKLWWILFRVVNGPHFEAWTRPHFYISLFWSPCNTKRQAFVLQKLIISFEESESCSSIDGAPGDTLSEDFMT